jgi:hypothetical protein
VGLYMHIQGVWFHESVRSMRTEKQQAAWPTHRQLHTQTPRARPAPYPPFTERRRAGLVARRLPSRRYFKAFVDHGVGILIRVPSTWLCWWCFSKNDLLKKTTDGVCFVYLIELKIVIKMDNTLIDWCINIVRGLNWSVW